MHPLAYIPSPSEGVWHLGFVPIRAYALMIIVGIVVAVWLGEKRWVARGGSPNAVVDIAVWAVPFGLVGGRLYHVITDYQLYFGEGKNPVNALMVWQGGLGIWGAIALGALGAWIGCRRRNIPVGAFADALAPGVALAQAIGRWGNWWNQELYGRPLHAWWAVKIDVAHRPQDPRYADIATYHPTFLYESLWCTGVAVLVIWAGRRFSLTHGRTFALYVAAYTIGRFWIESLRIDTAHHVMGMRLNDWTALIVFLGAAGYLLATRRRHGAENVTVEPAYAGGPPLPKTTPSPEPVASGVPVVAGSGQRAAEVSEEQSPEEQSPEDQSPEDQSLEDQDAGTETSGAGPEADGPEPAPGAEPAGSPERASGSGTEPAEALAEDRPLTPHAGDDGADGAEQEVSRKVTKEPS
ncbi:MAG TPA: prolipoprotein diacylglyceryl transferase [Actinomadura sp.]|jgi:prolipoprotein diacylglyceryl transferase|nr:prolipoprotein diacylglyceryl transferase [Actinomadura sp.]